MLPRMTLLRAGAYSAGGGLALIVLGIALGAATNGFGPCGPSNICSFVPFYLGIAVLPIGLILILAGGVAKLIGDRTANN